MNHGNKLHRNKLRRNYMGPLRKRRTRKRRVSTKSTQKSAASIKYALSSKRAKKRIRHRRNVQRRKAQRTVDTPVAAFRKQRVVTTKKVNRVLSEFYSKQNIASVRKIAKSLNISTVSHGKTRSRNLSKGRLLKKIKQVRTKRTRTPSRKPSSKTRSRTLRRVRARVYRDFVNYRTRVLAMNVKQLRIHARSKNLPIRTTVDGQRKFIAKTLLLKSLDLNRNRPTKISDRQHRLLDFHTRINALDTKSLRRMMTSKRLSYSKRTSRGRTYLRKSGMVNSLMEWKETRPVKSSTFQKQDYNEMETHARLIVEPYYELDTITVEQTASLARVIDFFTNKMDIENGQRDPRGRNLQLLRIIESVVDEGYIGAISYIDTVEKIFHFIHFGMDLLLDYENVDLITNKTVRELVPFLNMSVYEKGIVIEIDGVTTEGVEIKKFYTLNHHNIVQTIENLYRVNNLGTMDNNQVSDMDFQVFITFMTKITVYGYGELRKELGNYSAGNINETDGDFFPYLNQSPLDLRKYQIYTQEQIDGGHEDESQDIFTGVEENTIKLLRDSETTTSDFIEEHCVLYGIKMSLKSQGVNSQVVHSMMTMKQQITEMSTDLDEKLNTMKIIMNQLSRTQATKILQNIDNKLIPLDMQLKLRKITSRTSQVPNYTVIDTISSINNKITNMLNQSFAKNKLAVVANRIGHNIRLQYFDVGMNKPRYFLFKTKTPVENTTTIQLALYKHHFFCNESVLSSPVVFRDIVDIANQVSPAKWTNIKRFRSGKAVFDTNNRTVTPFKMISTLFENDHFVRYHTKTYHEDFIGDFDESAQKIDVSTVEAIPEYSPRESDDDETFPNLIYVADFETAPIGKHIPFMVSVQQMSPVVGVMNTFQGTDCGKQLLNFLPETKLKSRERGEDGRFKLLKTRTITILFHNLKYDLSFLADYLNMSSRCVITGNTVYKIDATFYGKHIILEDSLKKIPRRVSEFPEMFGLVDQDGNEIRKEVFPYTAYTETTIEQPSMKISFALEHLAHLSEDEREHFLENIEAIRIPGAMKIVTNLVNGKITVTKEVQSKSIQWKENGIWYFDHMAYAKFYCELDVHIQLHGLLTMENSIRKLAGIELSEKLTLPSLSHAMSLKSGAYEGVYYMVGRLNQYIQKSVFGGEVSIRKGKMYKLKGRWIVDFDAVSLYPSAIVRLCDVYGYPVGKPENIPDEIIGTGDGDSFMENVKELGNLAYWVMIKIHRTRNHLDNPIIAVDTDGIKVYTNDVNEVVYVVNMITLEDWFKYHDIEFDVISGIYFPDGYNTKNGEVIKTMFNDRLRLKRAHNKLEQVIKLLLNANYGKTIMKFRPTETNIVHISKFARYMERRQNRIISADRMGDNFIVKEYSAISEHKNINPVGSLILSMSKRIMYEMKIGCCEMYGKLRANLENSAEFPDYVIKVFYQDTDSIHLYDDDLEELCRRYKEMYGRDLVGPQLGQFHSDFDSPDGERGKVVSTLTIILAKKVYLDVLLNVDTGATGLHIRCKGVGSKAIIRRAVELLAEEKGIVNPTQDQINKQVIKIFKHLLAHKPMTFNLVSPSTPKFKHQGFNSVTSLPVFYRTIKFGQPTAVE